MKIIFYKLLDKTNNNCYIGSTQNIKNRFTTHKCNYNKYIKNGNIGYCSSFEILKNNNYELIILEEVEYNNLDELKDRYFKEREYLEQSENVINKNIPSRSIKEHKKQYYLLNKNKILERQNNYYKNVEKREKIKTYNRNKYYKIKNNNIQ